MSDGRSSDRDNHQRSRPNFEIPDNFADLLAEISRERPNFVVGNTAAAEAALATYPIAQVVGINGVDNPVAVYAVGSNGQLFVGNFESNPMAFTSVQRVPAALANISRLSHSIPANARVGSGYIDITDQYLRGPNPPIHDANRSNMRVYLGEVDGIYRIYVARVNAETGAIQWYSREVRQHQQSDVVSMAPSPRSTANRTEAASSPELSNQNFRSRDCVSVNGRQGQFELVAAANGQVIVIEKTSQWASSGRVQNLPNADSNHIDVTDRFAGSRTGDNLRVFLEKTNDGFVLKRYVRNSDGTYSVSSLPTVSVAGTDVRLISRADNAQALVMVPESKPGSGAGNQRLRVWDLVSMNDEQYRVMGAVEGQLILTPKNQQWHSRGNVQNLPAADANHINITERLRNLNIDENTHFFIERSENGFVLKRYVRNTDGTYRASERPTVSAARGDVRLVSAAANPAEQVVQRPEAKPQVSPPSKPQEPIASDEEAGNRPRRLQPARPPERLAFAGGMVAGAESPASLTNLTQVMQHLDRELVREGISPDERILYEGLKRELTSSDAGRRGKAAIFAVALINGPENIGPEACHLIANELRNQAESHRAAGRHADERFCTELANAFQSQNAQERRGAWHTFKNFFGGSPMRALATGAGILVLATVGWGLYRNSLSSQETQRIGPTEISGNR